MTCGPQITWNFIFQGILRTDILFLGHYTHIPMRNLHTTVTKGSSFLPSFPTIQRPFFIIQQSLNVQVCKAKIFFFSIIFTFFLWGKGFLLYLKHRAKPQIHSQIPVLNVPVLRNVWIWSFGLTHHKVIVTWPWVIGFYSPLVSRTAS